MKKIIFVFLLVLITACGSGGGGSSSSSDSYTGKTTQATIDSTNAKTLTSDAYSGGSTGGGFAKPGEEGQSSLYATLYNIFDDAVQSINKNTNLNKSLDKTVTESDTVSGSCGGTYTYSITVDDTTGSFSGVFSFSNYCSLGVTQSGSVTVSGSYNTSTQQISSVTFTFTNYSISSPDKSYTIAGTLTLTNTSSGGSLTMNLTMKDNSTSKTVKVENLSYAVTSGSSYSDVTISGRFYHPDHGYVDITTQTPFRIYSGSSYPSSGVLVITGANGKAKLSVISSFQYSVSADLDGNGTYETTIGTYSWGT